MKDKMKKVILGTLISSIISSTCVSASVGSIQKDLWYNNIKITLDNQEITPTDANGNYVEPFIIDGTTYLPVRAVSTALGIHVNWDANNNTVKLSSEQPSNGVSTSISTKVSPAGSVQKDLWYNNIKITLDNQEITPTDANGNYVEPFIIDGTTYLPVRAVASALGINVDWDANNNTVKLSSEQTSNHTPASIKAEELLSTLQGNWLCEYDVDPSQDLYYYLIVKFNGSTISSGFYASEAFPDETITGVTMIADNTFEVTTYTPAGEWFGEYYPEEYNTITLSSTDGFQNELIVTQQNGDVYRYLFAGTTPQETDAFFNQIIGK